MKKAFWAYIFGLILFGSNGVAASCIHLTSQQIVLLRTLLGFALLAVLYFATGHRLTAGQHKRDCAFLALSGVAMGADWMLVFEAYGQIGIGLSTIINYCGPILVIVTAPLFFRERLTWQKGLALALAMVGACLISGQTAAAGGSVWGLVCAGLSAVTYAILVISNKMSRHIVGMENALIQMGFTLLTVVIVVGFRGGLAMDIPAGDWPFILWLGLLNTGVGCFCYFATIGALPAHTVAICGYLEPISAVVFSLVILREVISPVQLVGILLILGGAVFGERASGAEGC